MLRKTFLILFTIALIFNFGCKKEESKIKGSVKDMKAKVEQFKPVNIKYDSTILDSEQKIVVRKLYEASKLIDEIFLRQVYSKNPEIEKELAAKNDELGKLTYDYFKIMFGPFDRLDHDKPFYGNQKKPLGANFYPENITKKEFVEWISKHPYDEDSFTSEVTVIRRKGSDLIAIPYSEEYKSYLTEAAGLLDEAAEHAKNKTLKKYLKSRAAAFLSNDYYQSDLDWMDLKDNLIEVVIGPFEVYEDELFNYKASFESFLTIVDPGESKKVEKFGSYLKDLEKNLPIPDKYKNFERGGSSPIVVANEVFCAGDAKAGVQTLAFNLPNDERVRKAKGSKKVMLKNIHEAKFQALLVPIAKRVLAQDETKYVTFEGFFTHTLMHEMSHGIGPGFITINGRKTEVKKELQETYSSLEECKADLLGMYNNIFMIKKGVLPAKFEKELWTTFLASIFRSVRFGINEAHGAGNAIIYNYLMEKGAYKFDKESGKVAVDYGKVYGAVKDLANKILVIQATGDYNGAKKLIKDYAKITPSLELEIAKLKDLPVDIKPVFAIENEK